MSNLQCPRCETPLIVEQVEDVEIEMCPTCHGVLVENRELTDILQKELPVLVNEGESIIDRKEIKLIKQSETRCPRCQQPMREFNYGYKKEDDYASTDIVINSCLPCKTVWLDSGEINAIRFARKIPIPVVNETHSKGQITSTQTLLCPHCKTQKLTQINKEGIEIEFCPKCLGLWLDHGELYQLMETSFQETKEEMTPSPGNTSERNCPKCHLQLSRHPFHLQIPTLVDSCLKCHGFWLEHGEFDEITEALTPDRFLKGLKGLKEISKDILP